MAAAVQPTSNARFERGFDRFRAGYRALLCACLTHRGVFGLTFLGFCVASGVLVFSARPGFFPSVDAGQFLLHVRARTGTRIEETIRLCSDMDAAIRKEIPAKEFTASWTTSASRIPA